VLDRPDFNRVGRTIFKVLSTGPSWGGAAVFFGLVGLIVPYPAWATHETDHRFTISGYVRDKDGKPVKDVRVQARDLRDQSVDPVNTYADGSGFYKVVLHLHNHNVGDPIQVSIKGSIKDERSGVDEVKKIRAEYDPNDRRTEREGKVNFGPEPERSTNSGVGGLVGTAEASSYWLYGLGGILALAAIGAGVAWARHQQAKAVLKRRGQKR
jgi:hypothetical protein